MTSRSTPRISSRKHPKQARSRQLVADILTAAGRVLARDGARSFTAARVAEEAGVSVGSLYQYFPNKEALLFRLQTDEWEQTGGLLAGILPRHVASAVGSFAYSRPRIHPFRMRGSQHAGRAGRRGAALSRCA